MERMNYFCEKLPCYLYVKKGGGKKSVGFLNLLIMKIHFMNVGQGNMVLIQIPNNKTIIYDCNITKENEYDVLNYLDSKIKSIDIFINSHRDADHMRGIEKLENRFGISEIWDSGVSGATTDSSEYFNYMNLRRSIGKEVEALKYWTFGDCKLRIMNSKNSNFDDANEQSLVVKLEYGGNGVMLAGDTSYRSWKEFVEKYYSDSDLSSEILLASHHGSISFFDDPNDEKNYYVSHIKKINPAMTIISVGDSTLLDDKAVKLYEKYSRGSEQGNKVFTTLAKGNMLLTLKSEESWSLSSNQK